MKIAIIGSGISGLTCAWYLHRQHRIKLFEADARLGGHTATIDVEVPSGEYAIDTGFIVFNDRTYPNFEDLLAQLKVERLATEMSFSVSNEVTGLEYNGHSLASMFAQKRNLVRPSFYRFITDILRFNKKAKQSLLEANEDTQTLGDFLEQHRFSDDFATNYILPMGAAIWSSTLTDMRSMPLGFFLRFFDHHGLLDVANRPQWYVIPGGSREYIRRMVPHFADRIALRTPVTSVKRVAEGIEVKTANGIELFDQVVLACHSDQALAMLAEPSQKQRKVLGAMRYQDNEVVLHTDTSLLPKRKGAWASWNYRLEPAGQQRFDESRPVSLTYNMNILQRLKAPETFCVSLNQGDRIPEDKVLNRFTYAHPVFDPASLQAQTQRHAINGEQGIWFCGAYWYNGFHEDGVRSALDVVAGLSSNSDRQQITGTDGSMLHAARATGGSKAL